jgi:hypothetical protein
MTTASRSKLTVLSPQVDPFRMDAPGHRKKAQWFMELIERFCGESGNIHLRGLHYKALGKASLPEMQSMPYINTISCWVLMQEASRAARWLKYVPWERVFDNRNDPPAIYVPEYVAPYVCLDPGLSVKSDMPSETGVLPSFTCDVKGRQPYRIILFGEKSSLLDVLEPIAQSIGAEMVLCTGEASSTRVTEIATRASIDGRPLVVLFFFDFDPGGWQMAISASRKLQAAQCLLYPDLEIQTHLVSLTSAQVKEFNLPETPLKEEEKRADKWKAKWGHEQTEIDALLALNPETLREITLAAIKPFYDETLSERSEDAWDEWYDEAAAMLEEHSEYIDIRTEILDARRRLVEASDDLVEAQRRAYRTLREIEPPQPTIPEPEITVKAPEPIFTTEDDYETASIKLINRKRLIGDLSE